MDKILPSLHTYWIMAQIQSRHTHAGERTGLQSRLEDTIVDVLGSQETSCIYVHWGVYESGKSRAASNAAIRLQDRHGKLVMLRHGWDFTHKNNLRDWLRLSIGIPDDRQHDKLSTFFPNRKAVLILDHPDFLLKLHGEGKLVDNLRELDIPVLILMNSWERAVELKNCGCRLLGEPGFDRWTEHELSELFKTFSPLIQDKDQATKLNLMKCAALSRSPGVLFHECHRGEKCNPDMRRANIMHTEWQNGMRALQGQSMGDITGRFPDKNGTFHWD